MKFRHMFRMTAVAIGAVLSSSTALATVPVELPEPASLGLLGIGLAGLATRALAKSRRRRDP